MSHKGFLVLACLTTLHLPAPALAEANYTLTIDGTVIDVPVNEEIAATLKDGRTVTLRLAPKPVLSFTAEGLHFQYPSGMSVSTSQIEPGIFQHMIATATGTFLILQTYDDLDATALVTLMTGKMTDDDVATGATRETKPYTRRLMDGTEISGTRSEIKALRDDTVVEVLARRRGKGGTMLITRHDRKTSPEDTKLIDIFWASLRLE